MTRSRRARGPENRTAFDRAVRSGAAPSPGTKKPADKGRDLQVNGGANGSGPNGNGANGRSASGPGQNGYPATGYRGPNGYHGQNGYNGQNGHGANGHGPNGTNGFNGANGQTNGQANGHPADRLPTYPYRSPEPPRYAPPEPPPAPPVDHGRHRQAEEDAGPRTERWEPADERWEDDQWSADPAEWALDEPTQQLSTTDAWTVRPDDRRRASWADDDAAWRLDGGEPEPPPEPPEPPRGQVELHVPRSQPRPQPNPRAYQPPTPPRHEGEPRYQPRFAPEPPRAAPLKLDPVPPDQRRTATSVDPETQWLRRYVPAGEVIEREPVRRASHPPRAVVRRRRARRRMLEWPVLIVLALLASIGIRTYALQTFFIPSGSMHQTLIEGDRVLVNKLSYKFGDIKRGDVVVFEKPPDVNLDDKDLIKRVVAVGGDTVEARADRKVYVNGQPMDEPYVEPACNGTDPFAKVTVPAGRLWVMGDNRCDSDDSRFDIGFLDQNLVVGRAFILVWPAGRISWL